MAQKNNNSVTTEHFNFYRNVYILSPILVAYECIKQIPFRVLRGG